MHAMHRLDTLQTARGILFWRCSMQARTVSSAEERARFSPQGHPIQRPPAAQPQSAQLRFEGRLAPTTHPQLSL